jgi:Hypothetical protein (DUF2513)
VLPFELTWQGHELLDKIRNPTIWDAIRADVKAKGLESVSLEVIKQIADRFAASSTWTSRCPFVGCH